MSSPLRYAGAGAVAALAWAAAEPLDRRLLRHDYSDVALLGKWLTRGPLWRPAGLAWHAANGALFALGLRALERRRGVEPGRLAVPAALLGGDGDPAESPQELRELIVAAAAAGDDVRVARLLDQAFAMPSLEEAFTAIVVPALRDVGEAWEAGRLDVAAEHLVSSAVRARVGRLLADAREGVRGSVTLACAPGERHELGLMTLAVMLRRERTRA